MSSAWLRDLREPAAARRAMTVILAVAAAVRIAVWIALPDQSANLPDAATYRSAAQDILGLRLIGIPNVMPFYPLLIAATGGIPTLQVAADMVLSVATVWLIAQIVLAITHDRLAALAAAAIWALYPPAVFYVPVGLTETLFMFLLLLGFLLLYRDRYWPGSVVLALSILTRPAVELLAPVLVLAFAVVVHRKGLRRGLVELAKFALVYLMLMAPWWAHNHARYGTFVRLNVGTGLVLYAGNNPMNRSGGGIGGVDYDDKPFLGIADPLQRDRAMQRAAFEFVRDNPGRFTELAVQKFWRLWRPWPYAPAYSRSVYVIAIAASFVPVLLLGIAGLVWGLRRYWRFYLPLVLFMAYTTAIHMVTIGSLRYRFPMEPMLVVFAAPFVVRILRADRP